jgi:hypothetical protein
MSMLAIQLALPLNHQQSHPRRLPVLLFVEILASFKQENSGEGRALLLPTYLLALLSHR